VRLLKIVTRASTPVVCVALLSLTALLVWATRPGPAGSSRRGASDGFEEEARLADRLEHKRVVLARSIEAKEAIVRDLAGGKLTLLESASRLREVRLRNPYFVWEEYRRWHPGSCDDERYCREAIELLRGALPPGPDGERVVAGHEAELHRHLTCGTLCLPTSGAAGLPQ
jgi:hypothetical protein